MEFAKVVVDLEVSKTIEHMEAQKASKGGFCISFCPDIGDMSTTLLCQEPLDSADTEKGPEKAEARVSMVFHLFPWNCLTIFEACICQGERKSVWTVDMRMWSQPRDFDSCT